jgi:DNA (cytosine-5)-methyltransferase 1
VETTDILLMLSQQDKKTQRDGGHTTCYGSLAPDNHRIQSILILIVECWMQYSYKENWLIIARGTELQSFPDDYKIVSSSKQGRNLIVGNAVPPMLAGIIARELKKFIKED